MEETFYLLANPTRCYQRKPRQNTIDETLLRLLNKKFTGLKISSENYNNNITKIERIFEEYYIKETIAKLLDEVVEKVVNEQVLL